MDPMIGMVFMIPWNWAPLNYQLCQGQTLTIQQYEALYSLMGVTFGGNATTNFNLPNLQGRAPIGTGILNAVPFTLGNSGGLQGTTLGVANLPPHTHASTFAPVMGGQVVTIPATTGSMSVGVTLSASSATTGSNTPGGANSWLGTPSSTGVKMYGPAGTEVPLSGITTTVSGNPSTAAVTTTINSIVGGAVAIGATGSGTPFTNMPPYLAMSFVIAVNGLYPDRP